MTIRVEVEGKGVAEFPDGTPQEVIHLAVQRDFFGRQPSVSEKAGARLASRGLTLDQIKANPDVTTAPEPSNDVADIVKSYGRALVNPLGETGRGEALEGLNPELIGAGVKRLGELGVGMANQVVGALTDKTGGVAPAFSMATDMAQRYESADQNFADDPIRRGIMKTLAVVPVVGGPVSDILQPSFVATDRAPTQEERNNAVGGAVELGATLGGPEAIKDTLGRGTGMVDAATAKYAKAISTPLTEQLATQMSPELMDKIGVVRNTAKLAENARLAADSSALDASTANAMLEANALPEGVKVLRDRRNMGGLESARDAAVAEAEKQRNIQTIFEALPEQKSVGNILIDGIKKKGAMVGGLGILSKIADIPAHGAITLTASAVAAAKVLSELAKTTAWKTADAMVKRNIGKAMAAGDHATALQLGAGIASGSLASDDYGHRKAIRSLSTETEALPSPELRRQVIAGKKPVYVGPDGVAIDIPSNVMSGFVNARQLTETDSPLSAWLNAMGKQGRIKKGGTLEFR